MGMEQMEAFTHGVIAIFLAGAVISVVLVFTVLVLVIKIFRERGKKDEGEEEVNRR